MIKTPDLSFTSLSLDELESNILSTYEGISGKKLFDGDPVRIFLNAIIHIMFQQAQLIDFTAKQNLLAYATGDYLDQIVALVGVSRLPSAKALTTLRFTLSTAQNDTTIVIPKGTRVKGNELYFQTLDISSIPPGNTFIDVVAECSTEGAIGNNILPGQLTEIVDVFPFFGTVTNLTKSASGADIETDEALRQRAFAAPSAFSTAGSDAAYAFFAKSVSTEIMDVKVVSEKPGEVSIVVIGKDGQQLSEELLAQILEKCSDKKVKPLTDKVLVSNATQIHYGIDIEYYIDEANRNSVSQIQEAVTEAVKRYTHWQNAKLGRDINPDKLMYEIMASGVKRVQIHSPLLTTVQPTQMAKNGEITIKYRGLEDE